VTLVSLDQVLRSLGGELLFEGVGLAIGERDRIGVVGDNGEGKTTLLRLIAGVDEPDHGARNTRSDLRVAFLPQAPDLPTGTSVLQFVRRGNGEFESLERRMHELAQRLEAAPDDAGAIADYGHLLALYEAAGGFQRERLCERVLSGIGFSGADLQKDVAVLSGGEKSRVLLCALITQPADLLLLDEPTNHLDLLGIEFLEEFVHDHPGAVVAVSHDRRFLDRTCTSIVEVALGKVTRYAGDYSAYVRQRDLNLLTAVRMFKDQQAFLQKELDYIRRNIAGRHSSQAKGRLKRLQRLERLEAPRREKRAMTLRLAGGKGQGGQALIEAVDLRLVLGGRTLLDRASFKVFAGEVLGVLGRNGQGKTTLLRALAGQVAPAAGRLETMPGLRFAFFTQEMTDLPAGGSVLDALRAIAPLAPDKTLRDHLGLFLFTGDDAEKPVAVLSGGEKRRLCLARLTFRPHDVLLLDEPTNHLDITTRERLEDALLGYDGTAVVVSHDRSFLERVADRVLYLEGGAARTFDGGLEQCLARLAQERRAEREERAGDKERAPASAAERRPPAGKVRNPLLFQRLEERIFALEDDLTRLRAEMAQPECYNSRERSRELLAREAALKAELAECYARWENWG
jgi:ATP-binding cassette subfamily F protein 3